MDSQDLLASRGPTVLAVVIVFPILATITVACRLYTRIRIINNASIDDYFSVVGLVFSVATSICMGYQVKYGMGRHIQTLTPQQGIASLKALFASILVYNFSLLFIKLSILFQYLRIITSPGTRRACYAVIALVTLYGIETFFTGLFTCFPIAKFWNASLPGHCVHEPQLWFANAGLNIFSDLLLLLLPAFILKASTLGLKQKLWLTIVLGLGGFACIASVCRLRALYVVTTSRDITWDNPGTAIWSSIELNVGIIGACLGTLRPFGVKFFPRLMGVTTKGQSGHVYDAHPPTYGAPRTRPTIRQKTAPPFVDDPWDWTLADDRDALQSTSSEDTTVIQPMASVAYRSDGMR